MQTIKQVNQTRQNTAQQETNDNAVSSETNYKLWNSRQAIAGSAILTQFCCYSPVFDEAK